MKNVKYIGNLNGCEHGEKLTCKYLYLTVQRKQKLCFHILPENKLIIFREKEYYKEI